METPGSLLALRWRLGVTLGILLYLFAGNPVERDGSARLHIRFLVGQQTAELGNCTFRAHAAEGADYGAAQGHRLLSIASQLEQNRNRLRVFDLSEHESRPGLHVGRWIAKCGHHL